MATKQNNYIYKAVMFTEDEMKLLREMEKCFVENFAENFNFSDTERILNVIKTMYPGPQNLLQAYENARELHNHELWFDITAFVDMVIKAASKVVYTDLCQTLNLQANGYETPTTGGGIDI